MAAAPTAERPSPARYNGGSDLQDELGEDGADYSTFFRRYDPALGRFQGVDPLADEYADQTPYNFSFNDPANLQDPSGATPWFDSSYNLRLPDRGGQDFFSHGGYGGSGGAGGWESYSSAGPLPGLNTTAAVQGNLSNRTNTWAFHNQNTNRARGIVEQDGIGYYVIRGTTQVEVIKDATGEYAAGQDKVSGSYLESYYLRDAEYYGNSGGERASNWEFWFDFARDNLDPKPYPGRPLTATVPDVGLSGASGVKAAKGLYTVYRGIRDGKTVYWGLTKNLVNRARQHGTRFDDIVREYANLSRSAARGLEQFSIDAAGGLRNLENKINSIGVNNPRMAEYYREAIRYLRDL